MKVNQIKAGALLSYVSMGLSTLISLVYTPIMIQRLGDSEFGVYQAVLPIISYLNLLSFGLGSAYVRYYSRYKTAKDKKGMAMLNGMFLTTYLVLGALVLAIGWGLSYCDAIFGTKLSAEEIALAERLLRILSLNAALTFPISVFESHVTINEQYLFQKIVGMGKQVLNPLIMIPLLIIGYRSVTLTIVSLVFTIVSGIVNITFCLTRLRMPFSFRRYDFALLREMVGFTFYVFLGIVVDNFNWSIGNDVYNANKLMFTQTGKLNTYWNLIDEMADGKRWTYINAQGEMLDFNRADELAALNANTTMWTPYTTKYILTDYGVEKASFLRLATLTLGYTLPKALTKKAYINSLRIYATCYNVFCLTNYSGSDPEVSSVRKTNMTPGVDFSAYPKSRQFVVGLNVNF